MAMITIKDSHGQSFQAEDTDANRQLAQTKGYTIDKGIAETVGDAFMGAGEGISSAFGGLAGYIPTNVIPTQILKGVGRVLGAKDSEEADKNYKPVDHTGKITIKAPDGSSAEVDDNDANKKLAQERGYQIQSGIERNAEEDAKNRPSNQGLRGELKVYAKKGQSEAFLGIPEVIERKMGTEQENANWEAMKEENKAGAAAGVVGGTVANMLMPGLNMAGASAKGSRLAMSLAEHMGVEGTSLVGQMALGAAKHAGAGAVYAAPHAAAQAIFDDPAKAGEGYASAIGLSAVLGAAAPVLGKVPSAIMGAANDTGVNSSDRFMKMIGLQKGTMKKIGADETKDIAEILLAAGANESKGLMSKAKLAENIEKIREKSGAAIGEAGRVMDELIAKEPEKMAGQGFSVSSVLAGIDNKIMPEIEGSFSRANAGRNNHLKDIIQDVVELGYGKDVAKGIETVADAKAALAELPALSFAKGQAIKSELGNLAALKKNFNLTEKEELARDVYRLVSQELTDSIERTAAQSGDKELLAGYKLAKKEYRATSQVLENHLLENMEATAKGNRLIGLTDHITGAAALAGHPSALFGVAAKKALESTPAQSFMVKLLEGMGLNGRAATAEQLASHFTAVDALMGKATEFTSKAMTLNAANPMAAAVGSQEKDPHKAYQAFKAAIEPLANDPEKLQAKLAPHFQAIVDSGDPDGANAYLQHQMQVVSYLHSQMPKAPNNPALLYNREYVPSAAELSRFADQVSAAQDPFFIVRQIEQGKLPKASLETVKVLFPQVKGMIAQRIKEMGYAQQLGTNQPRLPYNVRYRMQQLSDAMADPSMSPDKASALQANFKKAQEQQGGGNAGAAKALGKASDNMATNSQRLGLK